MTKFLAIKLIEAQTVPILVEEEEGGQRKRWPILVGAGVVIIILAVVGLTYLPKLSPKYAMRRYAKTESVPRMQQGTSRRPSPGTSNRNTGTTQKPTATKPGTTIPKPTSVEPSVIPWFGVISPILESVETGGGHIYSITTGSEGILLLSGILHGEVEAASIGPMLRSPSIRSETVLTSNISGGSTDFIVSARIEPASSIDPGLESVPPYLRGAVLREVDSLARIAGLSSVSSGAVGREVIPGGSRYLISIKGKGSLASVSDFIHRIENSGKMIEVSRFSLEGIAGKPIVEDVLKAGFIFRIYQLSGEQTQNIANSNDAPPLS